MRDATTGSDRRNMLTARERLSGGVFARDGSGDMLTVGISHGDGMY